MRAFKNNGEREENQPCLLNDNTKKTSRDQNERVKAEEKKSPN